MRNFLRKPVPASVILIAGVMMFCQCISAKTIGWVNVRDYGAVGDGVTDDTGAIQRALATLKNSGGTVYFPIGKYKITNSLRVQGQGIYIKGEGDQSALVIESKLPGIIVNGEEGGNRVTIEGLHFTTTIPNGGGDCNIADNKIDYLCITGVEFRTTSGSKVSSCYFDNLWIGILGRGSFNVTVNDNFIQDVQTGMEFGNMGNRDWAEGGHFIRGNRIDRHGRWTNSGAGITIAQVHNVTIFENQTRGFSDKSGGGIYLEGVHRSIVKNNVVIKAENGIQFVTNGNNSVQHNIIEGNIVRDIHPVNFPGTGISLQADCGSLPGAVISHNIIRSNQVLDSDGGIGLNQPWIPYPEHCDKPPKPPYVEVNIKFNLIEGNLILRSKTWGIGIQGGQENTVQGNHVISNDHNGIDITNGPTTAKYNRVLDNYVEYNGSSGIYVHGGAEGTFVSGNMSRWNGGHGIFIEDAQLTQIVDNVCLSNGNSSEDNFGAIYVHLGNRYHIAGNTVSSEGKERYGIFMEDVSNSVLTNNIAYGYGGDSIRVSGGTGNREENNYEF